jgi:glutamyl-tRNA reductase
VVEAAVNGRRLEAARAERLVTEELGRFLTWCRADVATPTIASLHDRAEAIRQEAIARQEGRWEGLCAADRARLEHLTRSIVGKLLHEPTVRLRAAVEDGEGNAHLASLRHLFALEGPIPSADAARGIS